jgi:5-methylthioribose kinase
MSVGIKPARCLWPRSYLTGRIQKIRIGAGGAVSKDIRVTLGVPHWSHLGPLCFIWNIVSSILGFFFLSQLSQFFRNNQVESKNEYEESFDKTLKWIWSNLKMVTITSARFLQKKYHLNQKCI